MFYSVELLTLRRHGRFAKCWLAANLSRRVFCNKFRRETIYAINVTRTCEELITYIIGHDPNLKLSLYLSGQLMLGVTRIFCYQIDTYLLYLHQFWSNAQSTKVLDNDLDIRKKKKKKRDQTSNLPVDKFMLPPVEPPASSHITRNVVNENSITLDDDIDFSSRCKVMMQDADWLNFGALTKEQMDQMLEHDGLYLGFRALPDDTIALPDVPLPVIDDNATVDDLKVLVQSREQEIPQSGIEEVEKVLETNGFLDKTVVIKAVPGTTQECPLTQILGSQEQWPLTPSKRKKLPMPLIDTPSKKKRVLQADYGDISVPLPNPTEPLAAQISLNTSNDVIVLDTLNPGVIQNQRLVVRKKRKNIVMDASTQVPIAQLQRAIQNLYFQTRVFTALEDIARLSTSSVEILLTRPSTQQKWGKSLLCNYKPKVLEQKPLVTGDNQNTENPRESVRSIYAREVVRAPDTSVAEQTAELSSQLSKKMPGDDMSKTETTKTLEQILFEENLMPQAELPPLLMGQDIIVEPTFQELPELPQDQSAELSYKGSRKLPKIVRKIISDWSVGGQGHGSRASSTEQSTEQVTESISRYNNVKKVEFIYKSPSLSSQISNKCATSTSGISLVKSDLLAYLESLWSKSPVVEFGDICSPENCTKKEAANTFSFLIELHASMDVRLMQSGSFGPIYVKKY